MPDDFEKLLLFLKLLEDSGSCSRLGDSRRPGDGPRIKEGDGAELNKTLTLLHYSP